MSLKRAQRLYRIMPEAQELAEMTEDVHVEFGQRVVFHGSEVRQHMSILYATPFSRTRDADSLEKSNWEVISDDLCKRFPDTIEVHEFNHWGCGWFDRLYVRADDAVAIREVSKWIGALHNYPVADDEHYSETEWEDNHPSDGECYSDDDDCPCEANQLRLLRERTSHSDAFRQAVDAGPVEIDSDGDWYSELHEAYYPPEREDMMYLGEIWAREISAQMYGNGPTLF